MESETTLSFEAVWGNVTPEVKRAVTAFWDRHQALPPDENPEERAAQVVMTARDPHGRIVGVCTAKPTWIPTMKQQLYFYRTMTGPEYREHGIAIELFLRTWNHLESLFTSGRSRDCIGIIIRVDSEILAGHFRDAVWPRTGLVFMGFDSQGRQIRVRFFEGAQI
jgi:hypothetical protein